MLVVCHSLLSCCSAAAVTFLQSRNRTSQLRSPLPAVKAPACATRQSKKRRTLRVAVAHADGSHTGKQVQVAPAVHVPQPLHVTLVDEHRLLVVGDFHGHGVTVLPTDLHHPLLGHSLKAKMNRKGAMK